MTFAEPVPFNDAFEMARSKGWLPMTLTSADYALLEQELKRRAVFSATMDKASVLQVLLDNLERLVGGYEDEHGRIRSIPEAKAQLREAMLRAGVPLAPVGTPQIKDFYSDARRQLMVETNVLDTFGFGQWKRQQDPVSLAVNPGLELVRLRWPKGGEPAMRPWRQRWADAYLSIGDAAKKGCTNPNLNGGRMVALKNHPIWDALGKGAGGYTDALGNPWPPFAFKSGMGQEPVPRDECIEMGIMTEDETIKPDDSIDLNESLHASTRRFDEALKREMGRGGLKIERGVLKVSNARIANTMFNLNELRDALGRWSRTGSPFRRETREAITRKQRLEAGYDAAHRRIREANPKTREVPTGIFAPRTGKIGETELRHLKIEKSPLALKMEETQRKLREAREKLAREDADAAQAIRHGADHGQRRFVFTHEDGRMATIDYGTKKYGATVASVRHPDGHELHADLDKGVQSLLDQGFHLSRSALRKKLGKRGIVINARGKFRALFTALKARNRNLVANSFNPNEPRNAHGEWAPTSEGLSEDEVRVAHLGVVAETERAIKIKVPTTDGGIAGVWLPKHELGEDDREKNHVVLWKWMKREKELDYHHGPVGSYQFKGDGGGHADHLAWKGSADEEERAARLKEAADAGARFDKKYKGKKTPKQVTW